MFFSPFGQIAPVEPISREFVVFCALHEGKLPEKNGERL